jgi:hypothetical protein
MGKLSAATQEFLNDPYEVWVEFLNDRYEVWVGDEFLHSWAGRYAARRFAQYVDGRVVDTQGDGYVSI